MNRLAKVLLFRVGLVALIVSLLTIVNRVRKDPKARAGLSWAVRSWITPPDADARWEQEMSGRRAWRQRRPG